MLKKITNTEFFQKLTDVCESQKFGNNYNDDVFIDEACRLICELPRIFSDQLDRLTMWDRIGNGIETSVSKSGGQFRLFVNYLIEYIKADYAKFAAHDTLNNIISAFELRDKEWQRLFVDNMKKYSFLIIAKSRQMHQNKKNNKLIILEEQEYDNDEDL